MKIQKYPNLTPWQPGQSGNPSGRKAGSKNMSTIIQELLDQEAANSMLAKSSIAEMVEGESITYAKAVALVTLHKALQGNMQAIAWLAEQQAQSPAVVDRATQEPLIISVINRRTESAVD